MWIALLAILLIAVCWRSLPAAKKQQGVFGTLDKIFAFFNPGTNREEESLDYRAEDLEDEDFMEDWEKNSDSNFTGELPLLASGDSKREPPASSESTARGTSYPKAISPVAYSDEFSVGVEENEKQPSLTGILELSEEQHQRIATMQSRFGVIQPRLEKWGREGKLYRFSCYVFAPGSSSNAKKLFQTLGEDPLEVLDEVSGEIENWFHRQ